MTNYRLSLTLVPEPYQPAALPPGSFGVSKTLTRDETANLAKTGEVIDRLGDSVIRRIHAFKERQEL